MPLSWNEIKTRAVTFTNEWKDEVSEDAEAKSFWDDFFNVFGISRRRVATFEQKVSLTPTLSTSGEGAVERIYPLSTRGEGKGVNKEVLTCKLRTAVVLHHINF